MKQKLSATELKILAIIAMTVDHTALVFVPEGSLLYYFMRILYRYALTVAQSGCFCLSHQLSILRPYHPN